MSEAQRRLMTVEEFYVWQLDQDERYELVDGVPVPHRTLPGASNELDVILVNCIGELFPRLRGKPCRVVSADTALRTNLRTTRRPDVMVECGSPQPKSYEALKPVVVVEVLSPSTRKFNLLTKLDEYRRVASLRHILLIDPDSVSAQHYSREEGGDWKPDDLRGKDATIAFSAIDISLSLGALYDRLDVAG